MAFLLKKSRYRAVLLNAGFEKINGLKDAVCIGCPLPKKIETKKRKTKLAVSTRLRVSYMKW